jgi:sterol desaturase/sphingolipid hydroxylase (fatty acid hydroxylase superfamily)
MYVNYAIHLPLVDMLMGTFKRPPRGQWPEEYGVMKLETVPSGVLAQTAMPFGSAKVFADFVGKDAD